jgi:hypothetical protein
MNAAGLIFDDAWPYLDHLAPLCALLNIPLILCEPELQETAKKYYPDLSLIEADCIGLGAWTKERFSHVITCGSTPLLAATIGPTIPINIWLPHGHSDKGQISPYFEALSQDRIALIYGQQMEDILVSKGLALTMIRVGHFRSLYYQKWRSFYDAMDLGVHFAKSQPTLLYAPTWEDAEKNCSFWKAFSKIAKQLPEQINLLVKPHPNTVTHHRPALEQLIGQEERGNLQFLLDFTPILPLLSRSDAYLGDRSSIGYDFLFFDRPLFFLDPHDSPKGRDLMSCGEVVTPETLFSLDWEKSKKLFSSERKKRAAYAFDFVSLEEFLNLQRRWEEGQTPNVNPVNLLL